MSKSVKDFKPLLEKVPCDFCGGTQFIPFSEKMRHGINLDTVLCAACGLVFTNQRPTKQSLNEFYDQYYHLFHQRKGIDEKYVAKSKKMAARRFDVAKQVLDADQVKLLEIGSGAGEFLIKCRAESSWNITGIELGTESYKWCKSLDLPVENVGIEDYRPGVKFSCIVSFHVLEHVPSPQVFLNRCFDLLEESGVLYLEVPNVNRPGGFYENFLQLPHLFNFSAITLMNYMEQAGFKVVFLDDAIGGLTVIGRKQTERRAIASGSFIRMDIHKYLKQLKRKNQLYKLAARIPAVSYLGKIRSLLLSF